MNINSELNSNINIFDNEYSTFSKVEDTLYSTINQYGGEIYSPTSILVIIII